MLLFVSISEDAMSMFERRGLPIRDVFDSSFDAVEYVPHLRFDHSRALLERRIVDLPVPFAALMHCMSSGLPRDLIRTARNLVALRTGMPIEDATKALMGEVLELKALAVKVQARRLAFRGYAAVLVRWVEGLSTANCEPRALLDICRNAERRYKEELGGLPERHLAEEDALLQDAMTQVAAFAYYSATLLEIFQRMDSPARIEEMTKAPGGSGDRLAPIDRLAAASQEFALDLGSAWRLLSRLRGDIEGLEPISFPRLYLDDPDTVSA